MKILSLRPPTTTPSSSFTLSLNHTSCPRFFSLPSSRTPFPRTTSTTTTTTTTTTVYCETAVKSEPKPISPSQESPSTSGEVEAKIPELVEKKIGSKVRVNVPLKVYHVPKVPEIDLTGMEGTLKQYVAVWKGKRISANLPHKIEFVKEIEGRGDVKFFAHLREDEFEFL